MITEEEKEILDEVKYKETESLLNTFKDLKRQSGSEDEKKAASYIAGRLEKLGIPFEVLWPEIYLSIPQKATLKVIGDNLDIPAKTPAYSMSTGDKWVDGELFYASSNQQPFAWGELEYRLDFEGNPKGKIVITEGVPSPDKVREIMNHGGVAAIFVQAGERIHDGICTTIWGTPELDDLDELVKIPVVSISHPDGLELIAKVKSGSVRVAVKTLLEEGWNSCPLVLAKILGKETEKFVLLHGHIDSWSVGIGDNALGCATMLEIARVLHQNKDRLQRSVWIAWWPGHSTGRFAGSTWFADHYALEISEHCVAHVNCESTGCIHANTYEEMTWTEDVDTFCRELVLDVTGQSPGWKRPMRAGDYSFHNIGVSSFFMQSSTIGLQKMRELGYYEVYGCGGNIEWHTEDDDLRLVDPKIFLRDTKLYLAGVYRVANAEILPVDCRHLVDSMLFYVKQYSEVKIEDFQWAPVFDELTRLKHFLDQLYAQIPKVNRKEEMQRINETLLKIVRKLIRLSYTRKPEFRHDLAVRVPPIPDLASILQVPNLKPSAQKFLRTQLVRGRNKVCHTLKECSDLIRIANLDLERQRSEA
ncbi:MAG TPA: M28 family peptidase [Desulfitobacterium dehalogenans]|uniref:M28 family peptidase n=1 Tax=Desulfitobacterium dehalogenans TaxID=36854 RepID=A0A7C7D3L2_9FIRM|nr:M28 family peptidase [Desulfitobacterium dehalogenans]